MENKRFQIRDWYTIVFITVVTLWWTRVSKELALLGNTLNKQFKSSSNPTMLTQYINTQNFKLNIAEIET